MDKIKQIKNLIKKYCYFLWDIEGEWRETDCFRIKNNTPNLILPNYSILKVRFTLQEAKYLMCRMLDEYENFELFYSLEPILDYEK